MAAPDWGNFNSHFVTAILMASTAYPLRDDMDEADGQTVRSGALSDTDTLLDNASDRAIFARLRAGDRETLDAVYRAYYSGLCQFAYTFVGSPDVAAEIVQDVFVVLMTREARLPLDGTVRGYLYASVRNRSLNMIRFTRRTMHTYERLTNEARLETGAYTGYTVGDVVDNAETTQAVTAAVQALPRRQQRAILLRYAAQLSFPEIAVALHISPDAARMLVNRATADLRQQLLPFTDPPELPQEA